MNGIEETIANYVNEKYPNMYDAFYWCEIEGNLIKLNNGYHIIQIDLVEDEALFTANNVGFNANELWDIIDILNVKDKIVELYNELKNN